MINQNSDVKEPRAFRPGRLTVPMHPAKRLIHSKTSVPAEPNPHSKPSSSMAFSGFRLRLHALSAFHKIFYSSTVQFVILNMSNMIVIVARQSIVF